MRNLMTMLIEILLITCYKQMGCLKWIQGKKKTSIIVQFEANPIPQTTNKTSSLTAQMLHTTNARTPKNPKHCYQNRDMGHIQRFN